MAINPFDMSYSISGSGTYNVSDVMVDIFKEAVSLGEGGAAVLDQVERTEFSK